MKVGIWLIGARGSIATMTVAGHAAITLGLSDEVGLVSARPEFRGAKLCALEGFHFGGHEICAGQLHEYGGSILKAHGLQGLEPALRPALEAVEARIRPGISRGGGAHIAALAEWGREAKSDAEAVDLIRRDLDEFKADLGLSRCVVINLASTEPLNPPREEWADLRALELAMEGPESILSPSSLYAWASFLGGDAYINFTPSTGARLPALEALAEERGAVYMGDDGKTGETLIKSILAELFLRRNLRVNSWFGQNILGNGDGRILANPENKASKIQSKDHLLPKILGYPPETHVGIDYVRSLGEWKVAWDHIHFQGFMGVPMSMEFSWRGLDSILAAPLILDLIRFTELAQRRGERGCLKALAPFFKDPIGVEEQRMVSQDEALIAWACLCT